ncbi:MAG: hypothetical protein KatS3mg100_026 [Candidatus Parcubacteria bacterium]|nr:MAG: hypothetical protein KatS3mg100_026 [Candidatus Parcubacteria bacterium]
MRRRRFFFTQQQGATSILTILIAAALIGGAFVVAWQEEAARFFSARAATVEELRELIQRKEQEILILQRELQQLRNLLAEAERKEQGREAGGPSVAAFAQFTTPLDPGDSGAEVRRLQELLYAWGYYPEGLITGYYGSLTQKAVERFQAAKGIVSSGSPWTTGIRQSGARHPARTQRGVSRARCARGFFAGRAAFSGHPSFFCGERRVRI